MIRASVVGVVVGDVVAAVVGVVVTVVETVGPGLIVMLGDVVVVATVVVTDTTVVEVVEVVELVVVCPSVVTGLRVVLVTADVVTVEETSASGTDVEVVRGVVDVVGLDVSAIVDGAAVDVGSLTVEVPRIWI